MSWPVCDGTAVFAAPVSIIFRVRDQTPGNLLVSFTQAFAAAFVLLPREWEHGYQRPQSNCKRDQMLREDQGCAAATRRGPVVEQHVQLMRALPGVGR